MRQKYEVHTDGRSFTIGEEPNLREIPGNWLYLRVESPEEMRLAKETLAKQQELRGIHVFGRPVDELWQWFQDGFRAVEAAGGAVEDEAGRLLAIHRLGRWDLPKGKVEAGEALDVAAVREVQEECGLRQLEVVRHLCDTWHTYARQGEQHLKRTRWYLMRGHAAEALVPQAEEDIDAVQWLDAAGVEAMWRDTYPSVRRVLSAWGQARHARG
ncbi:MAG TPA: NUDIX domain-containing protein [Flavobacteriales bacterium]|nr:NUDIX domain-containing protein [Flavobacteriales bacterium]